MSRYLVSGGDFDSDECILWVVDFASARAEVVARHRPRSELRVKGKGFTGMARVGGAILAAGFNALYLIDASRLRVEEWLHRPFLNDLHGICHHGDRIFVANTGLDGVEVFSTDRGFVGRHSWSIPELDAGRLAGLSPAREAWEISREPQLATASPAMEDLDDGHYGPAGAPFAQRVVRDGVHVNAVCHTGTNLLASCLSGVVVDVTTWDTVISFEHTGGPHDVTALEGDLWLTTVDGEVQRYSHDGQGWRLERHYSVFDRSLCGWCRGLHVGREHLAVGLTAMRRPPKHHWCDRRLEETSTALVLLERSSGDAIGHVPFEHEGHTKVFAILSIEEGNAGG